MNRSHGESGSDWPVIPIFGRRKRVRQAFYAQPSQDMNCDNKVDCQFAGSKRQSAVFGKGDPTEETIKFDDDMENEDIFGMETGSASKQNEVKRSGSQAFPRPALQQKMNEGILTMNKPQAQEVHKMRPGDETTRVVTMATNKYPHFRPIGAEVSSLLSVSSTMAFHSNLIGGGREQMESKGQNPIKKPEPSLQDKSTVPRMLTLDAKSINEIIAQKKVIFALFEIYGILDSGVTCLPGHAAKRFIVRDNTGSLRCIFWEIDRAFPQMRRGASVRCVGRLFGNTFQCLKIQSSAKWEIDHSQILQIQSKDAIDKCLDICT